MPFFVGAKNGFFCPILPHSNICVASACSYANLSSAPAVCLANCEGVFRFRPTNKCKPCPSCKHGLRCKCSIFFSKSNRLQNFSVYVLFYYHIALPIRKQILFVFWAVFRRYVEYFQRPFDCLYVHLYRLNDFQY